MQEEKDKFVMSPHSIARCKLAIGQSDAGKKICEELKKMADWADDLSLRFMFLKEIFYL